MNLVTFLKPTETTTFLPHKTVSSFVKFLPDNVQKIMKVKMWNSDYQGDQSIKTKETGDQYQWTFSSILQREKYTAVYSANPGGGRGSDVLMRHVTDFRYEVTSGEMLSCQIAPRLPWSSLRSWNLLLFHLESLQYPLYG